VQFVKNLEISSALSLEVNCHKIETVHISSDLMHTLTERLNTKRLKIFQICGYKVMVNIPVEQCCSQYTIIGLSQELPSKYDPSFPKIKRNETN
jgi:hypothetical protein